MEQFEYFAEGLKFYEVETKSEREHYVEGYITTSDLDLVNDIVTKACMLDMLAQIKSGNIKLDFDHDTIKEENLNKVPTGRIVDAKLDTKGIWVKAQINSYNSKFKEIWGNIKSGMIDAFSIAFQPIQKATQYIQGKAVRLLEKVKLVNVALTGNPVNPNAKFSNIVAKSLDYLESISNLNNETDLIDSMETEYKSLDEMDEIELESKSIKRIEVNREIKYFYKNTEQKSEESNSTEPLSGELNKMEEEIKEVVQEEIEEVVEETEVKSEETESKEEEKSEEEDEEEKEMTETKSTLEAEIKSLQEQKLQLQKELAKPEYKSLVQSSPESNKLNTITNRVNPLSLFA